MKAQIMNNYVLVSDERLANSLHSKGEIGTLSNAKLELSFIEAMYLLNSGKIKLYEKENELSESEALKLFSKKDKNFMIKLKVFSDLRTKGYVIKTALKYGFDFRIYEKGLKPGEEHAKWLVNCFSQDESFSIKDYSKLIRIGHSVKKKILFAIVDSEGDVTYWESGWMKI